MKMKKIINKIAIFCLLVGLMGCDNKLDQIPFDSFATENAYNTAEDFENAVRGIYVSLVDGSYYGGSDGGSLLSAPDVMSDNVTLAQRGRKSKQILHNWRYTPAVSNLLGLYASAYSMVYKANLLLEASQNFDGDNKAAVVAEAKVLRGMAHFDLVKTFGKIPTESGDANGSPGVAYVTVADVNLEPPRESVGDVYNKIVTDLTEALPDMPASAAPGRLNQDAVRVLLSRVYLYMGQWQNAADVAAGVTAAIAPRSMVVGVWEDTNKAGVLFYIPNTTEGLNNNPGVTWSQGPANAIIPEYVASFELFNLFAADDIRKDAYILPASNSGQQYNAIKKLFGRPGAFNGQVDYKIFRAAEAKLNLAEALFNLGNEAGARTALDDLRSKRYTVPPGGESGNALRDAIRLERRLEFAFEYQRFYDEKRWGESIERSNAGDLADGSGTPSEELNLPAGSFKFQLPLDQSVLDRNPNIVQTPGY